MNIDEIQAFNCLIEVFLFILVIFFWWACSRDFGEGIATDGSGQSGDASPYLNLIFGVILAAIVAIAITAFLRFGR